MQLSATLAPKGAMEQSCIHFHSLTSKTHERSWMAGNWPLELDGSTLQGNHQVGGHDRLTKLEIFLPSTSHTLETALFVQLGQRTSSRSLEANSNELDWVRTTAYTAGLCSWAQWSLPHGYIVAWEHRPTARGVVAPGQPWNTFIGTVHSFLSDQPHHVHSSNSALDARPKIKEQK